MFQVLLCFFIFLPFLLYLFSYLTFSSSLSNFSIDSNAGLFPFYERIMRMLQENNLIRYGIV